MRGVSDVVWKGFNEGFLEMSSVRHEQAETMSLPGQSWAGVGISSEGLGNYKVGGCGEIARGEEIGSNAVLGNFMVGCSNLIF